MRMPMLVSGTRQKKKEPPLECERRGDEKAAQFIKEPHKTEQCQANKGAGAQQIQSVLVAAILSYAVIITSNLRSSSECAMLSLAGGPRSSQIVSVPS